MYLHPAPLAREIGDLISGQKDLKDHVNEVCDRIDQQDQEIRSILPEDGRRERLIREAEILINAYPDPANRPPLFGTLVGVKDVYHVKGFATRANSRIDPQELTGVEAESVRLLRQAGALVLGKTVTAEFAYFEPGPTRNPHNPEHTPGGSSSGSAAAVAAGFSPLALGTQTIGSVNRPAAYCGVVGYKPSYNRISTEGLLHFSRSTDHVGCFTQDLEGMMLAAEALCYSWQEIDVNYKPVLGLPKGRYLEKVSPEALDAFLKQLDILKEAGYTVKEIGVLDDIDIIAEWHHKLISAEKALEHEDLYSRFSDLYRPKTAALIEEGKQVSVNDLEAARRFQKELRERLERLMWDNSLGLWVAPAATGPAPKGLQSTGDPIMSLPWTNAGLPVVNIPAGRSADGLPLSIQFVAPFMGDELLLSWVSIIAGLFKEFQAYNY